MPRYYSEILLQLESQVHSLFFSISFLCKFYPDNMPIDFKIVKPDIQKMEELREQSFKIEKRIKRHVARLEKYQNRLYNHWLSEEDADFRYFPNREWLASDDKDPFSSYNVKKKLRQAISFSNDYQELLKELDEAILKANVYLKRIENDLGMLHPKIFAERLKEARIKANLTQAQMAERLGIYQSSYAQYENMKREPSMQILAKLAKILNCSLDWLIGLY